MAVILRPGERKLEGSAPDGRPLDGVRMQVVSPDNPYVHLTELAPGYAVPLHSHSETEVTVILSGSARVGETLCEAGSVLIVPANESYTLVAGEREPLCFVVVRPRKAAYRVAP